MKIDSKIQTFHVGSHSFKVKRTTNGVVEIQIENPSALPIASGFVHAHDRLMQMMISKVVAQGRITEILADTDEAFAYDHLMRKMGIKQSAEEEISILSPSAKKYVEDYCLGINSYINNYGFPWMGKLLRFKPLSWEVVDVLALMQLHMYIGLAEIQEQAERFIIQAIQDEVNVDKLKALFSPYLNDLDEETLKHIRDTPLNPPYLSRGKKFFSAFVLSSNNWVISSAKTEKGGPYICFDPHLHLNRLPSIWYEMIITQGQNYQMGITTPGIPGILMGRSKDISAGFTYGFIDQIDFFVEKIDQGKFKRKKGDFPLIKREEILHRKKHGPQKIYFYETDMGVLERKNSTVEEIENGNYFCLSWTNRKKAASESINGLLTLWEQTTVKDAQEILKKVPLTCNWLVADKKGNIGYQQSGRCLKRKTSGLYPTLAWERNFGDEAFCDASELVSILNPEEQFLATANNDIQKKEGSCAINLALPPYRLNRIKQRLKEKEILSLEDMKNIQSDLYSIQAELFLEILLPLIPDTPLGNKLRSWDKRYTQDSEGATLFEAFYAHLLMEIYGNGFIGKDAWEEVVKSKLLVTFQYGKLDHQLLYGDEKLWFGEEGRDRTFKRVLKKTFFDIEKETLVPYGKKRLFYFTNLLFDHKLPKWMGFDYGPLPLEGSRATIAQGQIFDLKKRKLATGVTWRFVSDMQQESCYSVIAGGPSENRFSKYYISDLKNWREFKFKYLSPEIFP